MRPAPRSPRIARAVVAAVLATGVAGAMAAPADGDDPLANLIHERGLAAGAAPATATATATAKPERFVDRVRVKADEMVVSALTFIGVPYRRGGSNEDAGFDCSGFTRHVFGSSLGFVLPRKVDEQATAPGLVTVKRDELAPGDLVFFNTLKRTFSHVGIYIGDGKFIHSPRSGGRVRLEDMGQRYWTKRFTGARRAEPLRDAAAPATLPVAAPLGAPAATPQPAVLPAAALPGMGPGAPTPADAGRSGA